MKTTRSIIRLGNSKAITLPTEIADKLEVGNTYLFDINLLELVEERETKSYKCKSCELEFDSNDLEPYCPVCKDDPKVEEIFYPENEGYCNDNDHYGIKPGD